MTAWTSLSLSRASLRQLHWSGQRARAPLASLPVKLASCGRAVSTAVSGRGCYKPNQPLGWPPLCTRRVASPQARKVLSGGCQRLGRWQSSTIMVGRQPRGPFGRAGLLPLGGSHSSSPHSQPQDGVKALHSRKGGQASGGSKAGESHPGSAAERSGRGKLPGNITQTREPEHFQALEFADEEEEEMVRDAPFMDAVVKVYCVHTEPNYSLPWQKKRQYSSTGSGFMVQERRVLTNAHCVEHHTQVKVKRRGDDTKFVATVLAVGTECDIALLTVEDDAFWEGVEPLQFGSLPRLQDAVTVVGYPIGGDTISVTSGVVSRIEVTSYVHGSSELLGCQIDAAINSGNSGGPAFNRRGECVGIAFQSLKSEDTEGIGYIIPTPVIFHFLEDYEKNGRYTGFPILGVQWQRLESPALRSSLGLAPQQKGVMIRRIEPTAYAAGLLKEGDVIMEFDKIPVANDGTVPFRMGERISFGYLVSQKFTGETASLTLFREGSEIQLDVRLRIPTRLVPSHINGQLPSYFIVAGLVFTPVCQPYLESEYGADFEVYTPVKLLEKSMHGSARTDDEQVVVLSQVLANDVNIGYEDINNTQVLKLNGENVRNIKHLAQLVDGCTEPFMRFDLEYNELLVLETESARKATLQILEDHSIPAERSADLRSRETIVVEVENGAVAVDEDEVDTRTT